MLPATLLQCFEVPDYKNLFVIGCLESRITIHDQQVRAANLVWALCESGRLRRGDTIGIVGAGFAGLTAGVAALKRGLTPTIFESHQRPLHLQENSPRKIHPRLYDWPRPGWDREHALPFMRWEAGKAGDAVASLRTELGTMNDLAIRYSTEVRDVRPNAGRWRVTTRDTGHASETLDYPDAFDALILAIGFGKEAETPSYWFDDEIDQQSDSPHWVVAGAGDGALVDAARLRLRHADGYFALLDQIAELTPVDIRNQIIALEDFVAARVRRGSTSGRSTDGPVQSVVEPLLTDSEAGLLNDGLRRIFQNDRLLVRLRDLILESKNKRPDTHVTLVGRGNSPYRRSASMLNRWTIALLREWDREENDRGFVFTSGELNTRGSKAVIQRDAQEIDVTDRRRLRRFGSTRPLRESLVDHDWRAPFYRAFHPLTFRSVDDTRTRQWPPDYFGPEASSPAPASAPSSPPSRRSTPCYFVVEHCPTSECLELAKTYGPEGFGLYLRMGAVTNSSDPNAHAAEDAWELRLRRSDLSRCVYRVSLFNDIPQGITPTDEFVITDLSLVGTPELVYENLKRGRS